ncbi:DUF2303 family protein [Escherichia coli]|uniref:DUF2303 family protein n=1 Tax=Escherichia coli TaxID=562 RepID=UPI003F8A1CB8
MASERSTDVQAFIGELDGGVFETKIGAVLSEVASGVMNTKTKGKVSLNLEIEPFDENRVKIKHKLSYVHPTNRGKISEEDTTETVEAKTKDIMPVAFEFKCVPFEGLKERPFKLRLSIITGDRPVLVLRIIQLEAVQEEMANEFRDLLVEKFKDSKVETFIGTFTA